MRELRVTSCGFGKTVEEVERRRFVKLKRCVLEPAARGLWYLKFSGSKTMSFEEVDTTAFRLRAKDSADGLCDDQTSRWFYLIQTPLALIFTIVIWVYEIFRISGLLCVTNGLDPLEEQNLGTDQ
ncbi:IQ-domain 19 [Dorcoceras hygrometricum]|uniref:IQ-domain 19 n=1 Tax=Dorcoceras hygrometricum TaxID=472368 RepID=A0A2Z7ARM5_9LAMI|nr:IQ-domain 19 [Dorcoceras hygrometricum]